MANEFQQLPNPDDVPGAMSSGYQQQNTNMLAIQTGLDTTEPYDDGDGTISVPMGGIIEVSGVMFKLSANITLSKPDSNTAYWVAITDNGDGTANAGLVTGPGTWDPARQGCYRSDGSRTLGWVSLGTLGGSPGTQIFSKTTKGAFTIPPLKKGWIYVALCSGLGGGDASDGSPGNNTSGGLGAQSAGVPSVYATADMIFFNKKSNKTKISGRVGGSGGPGGKGGNGGGGNGGGGGGGAGSGGSGEATAVDIIDGPSDNLSSGSSPSGRGGIGGDGRTYLGATGGRGGNAGQRGADGNAVSGQSPGTGGAAGTAGGDGNNGSSGSGGGGGGGGGNGVAGSAQPDGSPGGYCNIYILGD
jgi:hypothetical protein